MQSTLLYRVTGLPDKQSQLTLKKKISPELIYCSVRGLVLNAVSGMIQPSNGSNHKQKVIDYEF